MKNERSAFRKAVALAAVTAAITLGAWSLLAATGYTLTNLASNQTGVGKFKDLNLSNAWGIASARGGAFWIADNNTGKSTLYAANGKPQSLVVTIPTASGTGKGTPTGTVFNSTTDFVVTSGANSGPASFIFDTEDGTISGWNPSVQPTAAVIAVNNSISGADYKGLAIGVNAGANVIYATNFHSGLVEMYDAHFNLIKTFTDVTVPADFAPFGIQNIGGKLFVAFAKQDAQKKNQVSGAGFGYVSTFKTDGTFVKQLIAMGNLNAPWGLAVAPATFKQFAHDLLVGNVGDGKINAYNSTTGALVGTISDSTGKAIVISGLWGLEFGTGGQGGSTSTLFIAAGTVGYRDGLFAQIVAN